MQVECNIFDMILREKLIPQYKDEIKEITCGIKLARDGRKDFEYISITIFLYRREYVDDIWNDTNCYGKMLGLGLFDFVISTITPI